MKSLPHRLASAAFAVNVAYILWLICVHLNFLQIDLAGHMAGAMSLLRVGLHGYQDQFFQGYVTNLFYPPLEDFALAGLYLAFSLKHVLAFKVYLVIITIFFCLSIWLLSRQLRDSWIRAGFLGCFMFLLNVKKEGVSNYQGLSFWDLLVTGLSSQILGGAFFLLLIRAVISRKRPHVIGALLCVTILSHIIMGLMATVVVVLLVLQERRKTFLAPLTLWCLVTAFFTVPFVASKSFLVSSKLLLIEPWPFFLFAFLALMTLKPAKESRLLFTAALIALLPSVLKDPISAASLGPLGDTLRQLHQFVLGKLAASLPAFHYYRLGMPAVLLLLTGAALALDRATRQPKWWCVSRTLSLVVVGLWAIEHQVGTTLEFYTKRASSISTSPSISSHIDPSWGHEEGLPRLWFIENGRRIDFGLESYLSLTRGDLFFSKGLLWESSRSNVLITSSLATQFGPPAILDYFYYYGYSCESRACLVEQMAYDQGLQGILYALETPPLYLTESTKLCFDKIVREGTQHMTFVPKGDIVVNRTRYQAFSMISRNSENARRREVAEQIRQSNLVFYDDSRDHEYFAPMFKEYFGSCVYDTKLNSSVFIREEYKAPLQSTLGSLATNNETVDATIHTERLGSGHYKVTVSGTRDPALIRIKLNYLPGFTIRDSQGRTLPIYEGLSGIVTYAHGEIFLDFERPRLFIAAYCVSLFGIIALMFDFFYRKKPLKKRL